MSDEAARIGRPPKASDDRYRTPVRQLGRVTDEDWAELQAAANSSGKTFTAWALGVLKRAAKRAQK